VPCVATLADIFGLGGHRAIVTGASSGLGVELAEALTIAGCDVALVARRADRLGEVARRLEPHGARAIAMPGDLADLASIPAIFDRCEQTLGSIDILVNNAGFLDSVRAERVTPERWSRMLDVNVSASFRLCQEFAKRRFARNEPGRIVNVGSIFGAVASSTPGLAPYAASKGAITMLTRQLAIEWASRGITVNSLAPGFFPTELNVRDFERPGVRERVEAFIPLGRLGRYGELSAALLFLVSPTASYVTGSTVFVDGGYTAW
jgi:NAD(P)-dependent dehydrogenase (short-subunit alcohol dehydrogenase family)